MKFRRDDGSVRAGRERVGLRAAVGPTDKAVSGRCGRRAGLLDAIDGEAVIDAGYPVERVRSNVTFSVDDNRQTFGNRRDGGLGRQESVGAGNSVNIPRGEADALTDGDPRRHRLQAGVAVQTEGLAGVVHDGAVIVVAQVARVAQLLKLLVVDAVDVLEQDGEPGVPILAALLVHESKGVSNFVDYSRRFASGTQHDGLLAAGHADAGGAAAIAGELKLDVVGLTGARQDLEWGLGVPVVDRVQHAFLIGQAGGDGVIHGRIRPQPRRGTESKIKGRCAGRRRFGIRRSGFDFGHRTKDDVALSDGEVAIHGVADGLSVEHDGANRLPGLGVGCARQQAQAEYLFQSPAHTCWTRS